MFSAPDGAEMDAAFDAIKKGAESIEARRPQLTETISTADFLSFLKELENLERKAYRIAAYAEAFFSEDTQNPAALTLLGRSDQFLTEMANRLLFFSLWWKGLSDETAERLMKASGDYRYYLEEMRHFKPHTLSESEEKIINLKNITGSSALNTLYNTFTNRYQFPLKVGRKQLKLTRGELMMYVRQSDPALRAQAYQSLYKVYGDDGPILGQMYQTRARDWHIEQVTLRKFESPIAARNLGNDIPDKVVDTLLDVAQKNNAIFQRFFQLKARWLGMDRLRRYDIYAPVAKSSIKYPFTKAAKLVFESFKQFDPQFAKLADRVLAQNHLDSEIRKGKRDGAFCLTAEPALTPWVQVNYQSRADDVATLAHELGHAIHSLLADQHTAYTQHACLPLAETASTFGEMMLVDKLLSEETDETVKRDLLFRQMDDAYGTIQRQVYFALFERQAHKMVQENASVDDLCAAYMQNLKTQFGDAVEVSEEFKWEWVSIPHIYEAPFYVYAYSFGQLLVLSLYKQFKKEGESFKPKYIKLLSAGGSEAPVKVLQEAGVDVSKAEFWQGGFDVIKGLVDQLEKITK